MSVILAEALRQEQAMQVINIYVYLYYFYKKKYAEFVNVILFAYICRRKTLPLPAK